MIHRNRITIPDGQIAGGNDDSFSVKSIMKEGAYSYGGETIQ
jgi:hypothetical protein